MGRLRLQDIEAMAAETGGDMLGEATAGRGNAVIARRCGISGRTAGSMAAGACCATACRQRL